MGNSLPAVRSINHKYIVVGGEIKMKVLITIIGICAATLLLWYIYILMKGDEQK